MSKAVLGAPAFARPLVAALEQSGGLGLGMLAVASGDLNTGGRTPSIDQLRAAGDAALARRMDNPTTD